MLTTQLPSIRQSCTVVPLWDHLVANTNTLNCQDKTRPETYRKRLETLLRSRLHPTSYLTCNRSNIIKSTDLLGRLTTGTLGNLTLNRDKNVNILNKSKNENEDLNMTRQGMWTLWDRRECLEQGSTLFHI